MNTPKTRVFYDGNCGLCAKEIKHYQKVAPPDVFEWVDITKTPEPFTEIGFKVADGLKALHVQDRDGYMHIGVDAFIEIWRHMKRWEVLAVFVSFPGIRHIARFAYKHFANWRFKKLGYCEIS